MPSCKYQVRCLIKAQMDKVTALWFHKFSTSMFCDLKPSAQYAVPVPPPSKRPLPSALSEKGQCPLKAMSHCQTSIQTQTCWPKDSWLEQLSCLLRWRSLLQLGLPPRSTVVPALWGWGSPVAPHGCGCPMGLGKAAVALFTLPEGAGRAHLGSSFPSFVSFRKLCAFVE